MRHLAACLAVLVLGSLPLAVGANGLAANNKAQVSNFPLDGKTHLIGIQYGTRLSEIASDAKRQGYETATGSLVSMERWYQTRWKDLRLTWMTELTSNFGIIWGLGTGEHGKKYAISPSLKLGFIGQKQLGKGAMLVFRASTVLGGNLREKSCVADYGDIGGVQTVNCRLAATELTPTETLKYLYNKPAPDRIEVGIQFKYQF